jgi:hypothetical protein
MAVGDHQAALDAATTASVAGSNLGPFDFRVKEAGVMAVEAAIALGDAALARRRLEEMTGTYAGQRRHFLVAHAMRLRAALAITEGSDAGVEDGLKGAIGLFREMSYPYWTARSLLEQGAWLVSRGRTDEAEAALAESRSIFATLGAAPWLERVDGARTAASSSVA